MKIAIIDHVGKKAGMDYYTDSLAKGFVQNHTKVTIFSNFIGLNQDNVSYKDYFDGHTKDNNIIKLFKFIIATFKASYEAKTQSSDLVILHLFSASFLTLLLITIPKIFGLKVAIISHDVSSFLDNDNSFIQNLIYNKLSNYIIVHNKFSFDELLNNIKIKEVKKVHIIKHGGYLDYINMDYKKDKLRDELNLEINKKYILFFGQIKDVKGLDILLKALTTVDKDINLIIAGKPWQSDFSKYDKLIKEYNLENRIVKMIRFIEDSEREKLFFASDVNVLPYKIIYQSGVLLMAMSHKLPVIASDLQPNKEIIQNMENGLLFRTENSDDLSKQINLFFSNIELQNKLSINAFKTISNDYDWNKIAKKYIDLIKE
jgi:D-inositol-3-phosphate glycosyltransferase